MPLSAPVSAPTVSVPPGSGSLPLDRLLALRAAWRGEGRSVVFTNGVFDLLHVGHVRLLTAARQFGDLLVAGLNADDSVRVLKGPDRPVVPAADRAVLVGALRVVDHVVVFHDASAAPLVAALRPDVYVKGEDYAGPRAGPFPEAEVVRGYGGVVRLVPLVPGRSTTATIAAVAGAVPAHPR